MPGGFVYEPAAGAVLKVGVDMLSATFTPTDSTDYKIAEVSTSIAVTPATPAITWDPPAPITYARCWALRSSTPPPMSGNLHL